MSKLPCAQLRLCSTLRFPCASSYCGFDSSPKGPSPKVPAHVLYSKNILNHVFEDLRKPKAPNSRPRKGNVIHHVPRKMHNESATVFHTCNTDFVLSCKNNKVVARKLGAKCKGDKTCIWVPKDIVTNLVGPNKSWVPKTQA
jgi:hypothetical protein